MNKSNRSKATRKTVFAAGGILFFAFLVAVYTFGSPLPALQNALQNIVSEKSLTCPDCNLIVISLTNTRKDHIGLYGYERDTTPNIDEFFKSSLVFENAFSPASWTLPDAASFFTSLFPFSHGVMYRTQKAAVSNAILTLPEILRENGYATAAFTGGGDYNARYGLAQGFDTYIDESSYADFGILFSPPHFARRDAYLPMEELIPLAIDWLKDNKEKKKFLFLQGFDTHCPFTPRAPFDKKFGDAYLQSTADFSNCLWTFTPTDPIYENGVRYWPLTSWYASKGKKDVNITDDDAARMVDLYDGEIAQADENLAALFAAIRKLGLEKNSIIIFTAEHGDLFGEHGRFMRGGPLRGTFYDQVLNIPFLVKHPNIKKIVRTDALAQTVDFLPTLLEMLGLADADAELRQGKSVLPALREKNAEEVNEYVYAGSLYKAVNNEFFSGESVVEMVRNKEWKLIKEIIYAEKSGEKISETYELYNVANDPKEIQNLYAEGNDIAQSLLKKLAEWEEKVKR
ncbi:MAG: sulfatase [Patescibacteria group bacterium]